MNSLARSSPQSELERREAGLLEPIVSERWVVVTGTGGRAAFMCNGYRDDPAVTTDVATAQLFASREAAETAMSRYVEQHRAAAHALSGWRVLRATTLVTFALAS